MGGQSQPLFRAKAGEPYQKLMERVFPRNQLHPLHIGRGLGKVDVSFSSFLCAKVTMFAVANGNVRLLNTLSGAASPLPFGSPSVCFS